MRSKESMLRLHRFKCEDKRRQVAEIEYMIADLKNKVSEFAQQIEFEEKKTGVSDPSHFNYSTTAKSIRTRSDNILKSIRELEVQLKTARAELAEEEAELRKSELLVQKGSGSMATPKMPAPSHPAHASR
ncbi:MAG TPA: flagellar export protein FliJ [Rhizobiales bacterium]|nr:flagellar export protein FliJ [Hyphomicrobiales bacterium]